MATALSANVRWIEGSLSLAQSRSHSVAIDRLLEAGGTDSGFLGGELLLVGLGGCLASNVVAAVRARDLMLIRLKLHVHGHESDAPKRFSAIDVSIDLAATSHGVDLSDTELDKLILIAERGCLVSNTLRDALQLTVHRVALNTTVNV